MACPFSTELDCQRSLWVFSICKCSSEHWCLPDCHARMTFHSGMTAYSNSSMPWQKEHAIWPLALSNDPLLLSRPQIHHKHRAGTLHPMLAKLICIGSSSKWLKLRSVRQDNFWTLSHWNQWNAGVPNSSNPENRRHLSIIASFTDREIKPLKEKHFGKFAPHLKNT